MANITCRANVRSLSLLDAEKGVFAALLNVFEVNGHKLAQPIMVDEKISGTRLAAYHADDATEGFARGARIKFETAGINDISHRDLPAKDGYPARPLFNLTGPMTGLVVEIGVKARDFEPATATAGADKIQPAVAAGLLDKVMDGLGLTRTKVKAKK